MELWKDLRFVETVNCVHDSDGDLQSLILRVRDSQKTHYALKVFPSSIRNAIDGSFLIEATLMNSFSVDSIVKCVSAKHGSQVSLHPRIAREIWFALKKRRRRNHRGVSRKRLQSVVASKG